MLVGLSLVPAHPSWLGRRRRPDVLRLSGRLAWDCPVRVQCWAPSGMVRDRPARRGRQPVNRSHWLSSACMPGRRWSRWLSRLPGHQRADHRIPLWPRIPCSSPPHPESSWPASGSTTAIQPRDSQGAAGVGYGRFPRRRLWQRRGLQEGRGM